YASQAHAAAAPGSDPPRRKASHCVRCGIRFSPPAAKVPRLLQPIAPWTSARLANAAADAYPEGDTESSGRGAVIIAVRSGRDLVPLARRTAPSMIGDASMRS